MQISVSTGKAKLTDIACRSVMSTRSTGDVTGTLLSEKVFITETGTGSVNVPKTVTGGKCEIKTSTGDIQIEIR